jgi:Kdo2-lipid IVA lauroyltransferase/acyltransferase
LAEKKSWPAVHAEYALATSLVAALRHLPLPLADKAARAASWFLDRSVPKLRRVARTNLSFAYPHLSEFDREELIAGVFRNVARLILAISRFPDLNTSNIGEWIRYEGLEHYQNAKRCGRGVLIATAHLGNWELSAFAHALMTEPMNVMVRPLDNALIDRLVEVRRTRSGNRLIYKQDGARAVLRALRNNEAVGILIDQNTAETEGIFVDFFGRAACANSGFVKLAYHSEAPVIPGFAVWNEAGHYVLHFRRPIEMTGDAVADTQRIHAEVEKIIRQYPDQWMWIHRRWKTRPQGELPLY